MADEQLEKYRLPWKLHLMKEFYSGNSYKDLDTTDEQAFIRWARARLVEDGNKQG